MCFKFAQKLINEANTFCPHYLVNFLPFQKQSSKMASLFFAFSNFESPHNKFWGQNSLKLEHFFSLSELYQLGWETLPWLLAVAWDCIIGNKVERRLELDVGEIGSLLLRKNELVITTVHNLYFLAYPKNVLQYYLYITSR